MFMVDQTVAIVGAGPAGLAVAAELLAEGFDVVIYERHDDVGGIWDIENPGSPMYHSAHMVSSRGRSGFTGFPMPADYPDYPSRHQQLAYLRRFARARGLYDCIQFGSEVVSAERGQQGGWALSLRDGRSVTTGALVVANGHLWQPRVPGYPGTFSGTAMHAVDYVSREQFAGQRVLVVGGGNSAVDITCDAATFAEAVTISMRRGYHLVPKHIFGVPTDVFGHGGLWLPYRLKLMLFGGLVRLLVGDLRRFGLQPPDHPIMASHPIVNSQLVHHLQHGNVIAKPDIDRLSGETVRFVDGSSGRFDMIVWATGYQAAIPFLSPRHLPVREGTPDLFLRLMHRDYPDLFVAGLFEIDASVNPTLSLQGRLVAAALRASCDSPAGDDALRTLKRTKPELLGGVRHLETERHSISIQEEAYARAAHRTLKQLADITKAAKLRGSPIPTGSAVCGGRSNGVLA
jgi:hypothetical protein